MLNKLTSLAEGRKLLLDLQSDPVKKKEKLDPAYDKFLGALQQFQIGMNNKYNGKAVYNFETHTFVQKNVHFTELGQCVTEEMKIERDYVVHQIHLLAKSLYAEPSHEAVEKFLFHKSLGSNAYLDSFVDQKELLESAKFIKKNVAHFKQGEYLNRTIRVAQKLKDKGVKSDETLLELKKLPAESMYQEKYLIKKKQELEVRLTRSLKQINKDDNLIEAVVSKRSAALDLIKAIPQHTENVRKKKEALESSLESTKLPSEVNIEELEHLENAEKAKAFFINNAPRLKDEELINLPNGQEVLIAIKAFEKSVSEYNSNIQTIIEVINTKNSIQELETELLNLREKTFPSPKHAEPGKQLDVDSKVSTSNTTQKVDIASKVVKNDPAKATNSAKKRSFSTKAKEFFAAIWKKIKAIFAAIFPSSKKEPGI